MKLFVSVIVLVAALVSPLPAGDTSVLELEQAVRSRCLDVLRSGLHSDEFWPSMHAAEGLTLGGHGDEVRQALEPRLAVETDDQHRCGLARELVRAGDRSQARVMLDILAGEDTHGHVHAAESLYKVVEIGDGRLLRRAFANTDNISLKLMAAGALGRCGNPEAMRFLRQSLGSRDETTVRIASWVLGRIGDSSDVLSLKQLLLRFDDSLLQATLNCSLAALGDPEGVQALREALEDSDPGIRTYAATFAGDARAVGTSPQLVQMLDDPHADAAIRAAQSLLVLAKPPAPPRDEDVSVVPFTATPEIPRYTEGSVIERRDGSLLMAMTEFHGSNSDFATARIIGTRSFDGGRTWDAPTVLQQNTGELNVISVTLQRMASGAIGMYYLKTNTMTDLKLYLRLSADEGATFGPPTVVTSDDGYHVVNNDRVLRLSSGRLVVPAASTPDAEKHNHYVSHCYLSDDDGVTWRDGSGTVDADRRGAMEPEVVELKGGRLMMVVRTQLGYPGKSYSEDGGDTWSPLESLGVVAPESPSTLRRIPSTGDLLLIWNRNFQDGEGHGGKRTPLNAAISRDEGMTWHMVEPLESDTTKGYSYTSLTFVRDRAVFSYWVNPHDSGLYHCRFRSLPVSWFYR